MNKQQQKKLNKILFNMLGKNPAEFLLISQEDGWIPIKDLHKALMEEKLFTFLTPKALKQHFLLYRPEGLEVNEDYVRVTPERLDNDLFSYPPSQPPDHLFTPIRPKAYTKVKELGLSPGGRPWLILCSSRQKAMLLGKRIHQDPIIIKVLARSAHNAGHVFHYAGSELYLTKEPLKPTWLDIPLIKALEADNAATKRPKPDKKRPKRPTEQAKEINENDTLSGTFIPSIDYFQEFAHFKEGRRKRRARREQAKRKRGRKR